MQAPTKVPVSARALLQRINRKLAKAGEMVHKSRSGHCGEYFRIDTKRNILTETAVNLDGLGRRVGVLRAWETLAGDKKTK